MGLATFRGGAHPYEGKELSENSAIKQLDLNGDFVFPMSQGIGAPAKPIVNVGDHVLAGQCLAEAGGFISANVNSSVSGTVKAIEPRMTSMGFPGLSVVVESDGQYETMPGIGEDRDWTKLSAAEIVQIVKEAGIVGMGGAGFPTSVKLAPKDANAIDYFIVNGAECEPYITSDYRLMMEEGERIVGGAEICLKLFPNAKGVIAIENNKPEAIKKMRELVKDKKNLEVLECLTKYPEGGERQLINAVTGRFINSKMLPADAGCVVDNAATVAAIYDAVAKSTPIMQKVITVTGEATAFPSNVRVRLGVSYGDVLEACGGTKAKPQKYICGGPMMGMALFDINVPVCKNTSALIAFAKDPVALNPTTACIRCGRCVEACPEFLVPQLMADKAASHDLEGFEKLHGMECMECGTCSFVCPAKRQLTQSFKEMRKLVMADRRLKQAEAKRKEEEARKEKEDAAK